MQKKIARRCIPNLSRREGKRLPFSTCTLVADFRVCHNGTSWSNFSYATTEEQMHLSFTWAALMQSCKIYSQQKKWGNFVVLFFERFHVQEKRSNMVRPLQCPDGIPEWNRLRVFARSSAQMALRTEIILIQWPVGPESFDKTERSTAHAVIGFGFWEESDTKEFAGWDASPPIFRELFGGALTADTMHERNENDQTFERVCAVPSLKFWSAWAG